MYCLPMPHPYPPSAETYPPKISAPMGRVPLGYRVVEGEKLDSEGRRIYWEAHPDEARIVTELFETVSAGESLTNLLREFEERGIYRRDGRALSRNSALNILNNPTYAGYRRRDGEYVEEFGWERLIDLPTFLETKALLDDPVRKGRWMADKRPRYLLTGIALCGVCGRTMTHVRHPRGGKSYDHYRCYQRGSHTVSRMVSFLDGFVVDAILEMADSPRSRNDPLFSLALTSTALRRDEWDRLPLVKRRQLIREAVTVKISPVGKGQHLSGEGIVVSRKPLQGEI